MYESIRGRNENSSGHVALRRDELRAVIFFSVAIATEAGPTPQRMTVPSRGGYGGTPIGAGGYSVGALQFDFGHSGVEAMDATRTYVQALGEELNAWAAAVKRPRLTMPVGPVRGELDFVRIMVSNRRAGGLLWLPRSDWDLVRAWGDSDRGRQWIWRNIELRQVESLVDKVLDAFAVAPVGEWARHEQIALAAVLAKAWHRRASVYQSLLAYLADRRDGTFAEFERRVAVEEVNYPSVQLVRAFDAARLFVAIELSDSLRGLAKHGVERLAEVGFNVTGFREDPALRVLHALFKDCGHAYRSVERLGAKADAERALLAWQVGDGLGDFDAFVFDDERRELNLRTVSVRVVLRPGQVIECDAHGQELRSIELAPLTERQASTGTTRRESSVAAPDSIESAPRWIPPKGARIFRLPSNGAKQGPSDGPIVGESGGHWIQQTGADVYLAIPKAQVVQPVQAGPTPVRLMFHDGNSAEIMSISMTGPVSQGFALSN